MDLKAKLLRLRSPPVPTRVAVETLVVAEGAAAPPEGRRRTLETLRSEMERLLGKAAPPPRPVADPVASDLPFVRLETAHGALSHRRERMPRSTHVGRMPTDAALGASADLLALLSLQPDLSQVAVDRALFVDTETTGLGGGAGILPFLVGIAWFEAGELILEQFLLRSPAEELGMLELLRERVTACSCLVSFNGKSFDLPLLEGRYVMNRRPPLPSRPHLDLLHVARRLHKARLGCCRLVTVESEVLGYRREEDIEGADVAPRYAHFLRTGDDEALRAVVDHNAWDVLALAALVGLYGEPMTTLHAEDLVGLARTLRRAGDLVRAELAADTALARGAGPEARRVRGQIAKARGDRAAALLDFEALSAELDDPSSRLELAKLYEHHVKEPLKALGVLLEGTSESAAAQAKRRARLERKIERGAAAAMAGEAAARRRPRGGHGAHQRRKS